MKLIVDVKVTDLKRATEFYTKILGLSFRRQEKEWTAIVVGDAEIHLYTNGGVCNGIEFYSNDIDEEVKKLIGRGVKFISGKDKSMAMSIDENNITQFPWGKAAFFQDTEGNELAIIKDFE